MHNQNHTLWQLQVRIASTESLGELGNQITENVIPDAQWSRLLKKLAQCVRQKLIFKMLQLHYCIEDIRSTVKTQHDSDDTTGHWWQTTLNTCSVHSWQHVNNILLKKYTATTTCVCQYTPPVKKHNIKLLSIFARCWQIFTIRSPAHSVENCSTLYGCCWSVVTLSWLSPD